MPLDDNLFQDSDLCVVGSVCRDVKTAPFEPGEHLFQDGETSIGGVFETIGGGAANSAGIAAALGARARLAAVVGADELGTRLEEALSRAGVRCSFRRAPDLATGTTVNLVYTTGQRHFLSCHPNNAALSFAGLDLAMLEGTRHLLRGDVWFSEPMLEGGNEQLFKAARRRGLAVSLDLNWDPCWGHAPAEKIARRKDAVRRVLSLVDLAHGNIRELCALTDTSTLPEALSKLTALGVGAVVVHLGAEGAGYYAEGRLVTAHPAPVRQRVAATGTGDVLSVCMMLLHHRVELPVLDRLRLANEVVAEFIEGRPLIPPLNPTSTPSA